MTRLNLAAVLLGLSLCAPGIALAQVQGNGTQDKNSTQAEASATDSNFARDRNVSVFQRPRPDYEAPGIPAGGFTFYPRIVTDVVRDDNIYAGENTQVADWIFRVKPEAALQSNWSRHALALFAHAIFNRYASNTTEDTTDYGVGGSGRVDIERGSNLTTGGSFDRLTEPRTAPTSPGAATKPIRYDLWQANAGLVKEFNRLRLTGRVNYFNYNYDNGTTAGGAVLLQNDRDRQMWTENGRAEYAVSPDTSLYVSATLNQRNYRLQPPVSAFNRDSTGYDVAVGANFDLTHLVRGEIQVGYLDQSYKDPHFAGDIKGLGFKAAVDWFPTELTTVNLTASRSVEEAVGVAASGYLSTNVGAKIDHELMRNVLISANGSYGNDDYRGADRTDKRAGAGVAATYLVNRNVGLRLAYDYLKLDSSGTAKNPSFSDNKVTGSLTFQF